jgi:hypothetical protein
MSNRRGYSMPECLALYVGVLMLAFMRMMEYI